MREGTASASQFQNQYTGTSLSIAVSEVVLNVPNTTLPPEGLSNTRFALAGYLFTQVEPLSFDINASNDSNLFESVNESDDDESKNLLLIESDAIGELEHTEGLDQAETPQEIDHIGEQAA